MLLLSLFRKDSSFDAYSNSYNEIDGPHNRKHAFAYKVFSNSSLCTCTKFNACIKKWTIHLLSRFCVSEDQGAISLIKLFSKSRGEAKNILRRGKEVNFADKKGRGSLFKGVVKR